MVKVVPILTLFTFSYPSLNTMQSHTRANNSDVVLSPQYALHPCNIAALSWSCSRIVELRSIGITVADPGIGRGGGTGEGVARGRAKQWAGPPR